MLALFLLLSHTQYYKPTTVGESKASRQLVQVSERKAEMECNKEQYKENKREKKERKCINEGEVR